MADKATHPEAHDLEANSSTTQNENQDLSTLKSLIDDDVYKQLQKCFLRKGRGRPYDRPHIPEVTNRLLLQLYFLKEEDNTSFEKLKEWLERLVPLMESVTENRIYHRVQCIIKTCSQSRLDDADNVKFLSEIYCFHAVLDSLCALGLKRFHLQEAVPYKVPPFEDVSNQVLVDLEKLRAQERQSQFFVHKWMKRLSLACGPLSNTQMRRKADKCFNKYKELNKNKNKSDKCLENLNNFLKAPFVNEQADVSVSLQTISECVMCTNLMAANTEQNLTIKILEKNNSELASELQIQKDINVDLSSNLKEFENEKKRADGIQHKLKNEVIKNTDLQKELEEVTKSKLYIKNYAQKKCLQKEIVEKESLMKEVKTKDAKLQSLAENLSSVKKQLKSEQSLKSNYKLALEKTSKINSELTELIETPKDPIQLRELDRTHRYTDNVRKTYYALQGEANVAASNCSSVIVSVAKNLFNTDISIKDLPCTSSALNFSNEANVIAQHQVVDEIKKADHFTFASDATSRQKAHFLEQHIYLSTGKVLSLGFSEIASDDSDTLLAKCIDVFDNMCEIYCLDDNIDHSSLFKEIIIKMKALMSDRAAVMKLFDKKVAAYKCNLLEDEECSTHFIFCNAHFLLALSSAAVEAIDSVEKIWKEDGGKLGRDTNPVFGNFEKCKEPAGVRAIRTAVECLGPRGDEKNGSRQEWLAFCSSKDICSKFTSYRCNRFNNLFQNATALLLHKDGIYKFLNEYVSHSNLKLQSVIADIHDKKIISNVAALSFFHVFFTEPYWLLMNSQRTYFDFPAYVKLMDATLSLWRSEGFNPINALSVFPDFKANNDDVDVIRNFILSNDYDESTFIYALHEIIDRCCDALKRQLSDFLDGGIFGGEIGEDIKRVLSSCPLTNLTGERLFGDLDYDMNKRRNASLYLRSTTCMWKHNKTAKWLDNQTPSSVKQLVEKGIKYGPEWKQRHRDEKKAVQEKVKKRIADNKNKKEEKEIQVKKRKLAAIEAVLEMDVHLATTKEELDILFNGPKAVEQLKNQIRFRSQVLEEKITLKGSKQELYDKLLKQITSLPSDPN